MKLIKPFGIRGMIPITNLFSRPGMLSARLLKSVFTPALATSSGFFIMPRRIARERFLFFVSYREVAVAPGSRHETFTPVSFNSVRNALVNFRRKAFVGPYKEIVGNGITAEMDETFKMYPM